MKLCCSDNHYTTAKDTVVQKEFKQAVPMISQQILAGVESAWESIKNGLLKGADEI